MSQRGDWYRQSPALRNGTAFPRPEPSGIPSPPAAGMMFESLGQEVAFLRQQLAAAIDLVQKKDATESACIKRVTDVYEPIQQRLQTELKGRLKSLERAEEALRLDASRYATLRQVRVRAMQLGIDNLSGEELDKALDGHAQPETVVR